MQYLAAVRPATRTWILSVGLLLACSEGESGQGRDDGLSESDGGVGTQALSCEEGLVVRSGRRLDLERNCLAETAEVGCAKVSDGCDDALGYVRDAQGRVWQFGDLCLPVGLEQVSETKEHRWGSLNLCNPPPREEFKGCSELSTTECGKEPDCREISGIQYDEARRCHFETPSVVGCTQADNACPPAIMYARYPGAPSFQIASGCLPQKYERVEHPNGDVSSWPVCTTP